jgi:hypothetical protein
LLPIVNEKEEVVSFEEEAARLCALEHSEGAKGGKKHKKRENEAKMKEQIYHARKQEEVVHTQLKCTIQDLNMKGHFTCWTLGAVQHSCRPKFGCWPRGRPANSMRLQSL